MSSNPARRYKERVNVNRTREETFRLRKDDVEQIFRLLVIRKAINEISIVFFGRKL